MLVVPTVEDGALAHVVSVSAFVCPVTPPGSRHTRWRYSKKANHTPESHRVLLFSRLDSSKGSPAQTDSQDPAHASLFTRQPLGCPAGKQPTESRSTGAVIPITQDRESRTRTWEWVSARLRTGRRPGKPGCVSIPCQSPMRIRAPFAIALAALALPAGAATLPRLSGLLGPWLGFDRPTADRTTPAHSRASAGPSIGLPSSSSVHEASVSSGPSPSAGSAVTFVGSNHYSVPLDGRDATPITKPPGTQTGDFLISAAMANQGTPPVVPAGWTQIGGSVTLGPGWPLAFTMVAAYHIVQSGDTSWNWTHSVVTVTHAYRDVSATVPVFTYRMSRSRVSDPPIGDLAASSGGGDAAIYIVMGVYHQNDNHPPDYAGRVENTAADYGSGDRLNLWGGETTGGNLDVSPDDGNNDRGVFHAILTYAGSAGEPRSFYSLSPCRVVDTRGAQGPALAALRTRDFPVTGVCGVPTTAVAVALNVTVTQATSLGHLRVFPSATPLPLPSTLHYARGETRANNAVVAVGSNGSLAVYCGQATGTAHLILDVAGYFE